MENLLELFLIFAIATTYITKFMLLERKNSHFGPFPSRTKVIHFDTDWEEDEHVQPAAMFDYIRRLFGAYKVTGNLWNVKPGALAEVWTCPICLSFWMALLPAAGLAFLTLPILFPVFVLSLAGFSAIANVNWL